MAKSNMVIDVELTGPGIELLKAIDHVSHAERDKRTKRYLVHTNTYCINCGNVILQQEEIKDGTKTLENVTARSVKHR